MMITYLCPIAKVPVGGIKVLYMHAAMLTQNGFESCIFHPEDPKFSCDWFQHTTKIRGNDGISPERDFLIIPEIWAGRYSRMCYENGIKYAIFAQNGYQIGPQTTAESPQDLKAAFEKASLIMSISEDTSEMIAFLFPNVPQQKIIRLYPHVSDAFQVGNKRKLISFMPRKLREHAVKLRFYLEQCLPQGWEIAPIAGLDESGVARVLAESSIFLSLSDQEGCPLPPLEAALSGALVVGYTGQGAKEYFRAPNFQSIDHGDFRSFTREVGRAIENIEAGLLTSDAFLAGMSDLKKRYSRANELHHLLLFAAHVRGLYPPGDS
jgi:hypothetical protein